MRQFKLILILIFTILICQSGYCQKATNFFYDVSKYFKYHKIDSIEGLYTISDDIIIEPTRDGIFRPKEHTVRDHWAKVALIRDSTSLTRDYLELIIQAPNFKEGEVRAEYLRTKQNPQLFISKQLNYAKEKIETMMFEFMDDGEILVAKYEYMNGDDAITLNRTYLKYYPRK